MDRTRKRERIALGAMVVMVVLSLFAAAYGHIAAGFVLFLAAATPLPMLAAIRARRSRDAVPAASRDPVER